MFKFEPIERCLFNGVSSAMIADGSVRNEFLMRFGEESLDDRVSVVLTDRNIQFFYYDAQGEYDILKDARDSDHLKEIGSISLTSPKETGNDILSFPQNGFLPEKYKEEEEGKENVFGEQPLDSLLNVIGEEEKGFCKMFSHFPFMEEKRKKTDDVKDIFRDFAKCCLLAFVFEIEDREENFANSPLYDEVRTSLRKSDVYNLLSAKIRYTLYISDKGINYNREEFSYKTRKFADRLMDKNINKVIAPYNYPSGKGQPSKGQSWFYNPEDELEEILEKNRRQFSGESSESASGELVLEPQLEMKIQNFLYTKHAVYSAMTRYSGKAFFVAGQILMAIIWICIAWACLASIQEIFKKSVIVNKIVELSKTVGIYEIISSFFEIHTPVETFKTILDKFFPVWVGLFSILYFLIVLPFGVDKRDDNGGRNSKRWSKWPQLCMTGVLIFSLVFSVCYSSPKFLISTGMYALFLFGAWLVLIICSGVFNNPLKRRIFQISNLQPFFPRILVATMAAWLTIGLAEDTVKSLLHVDGDILLLAIISVLFLIFIILYGEIMQHSPYLKWKTITCRALLILNHSIFFAFGFGLIMQSVFYGNLVKTSDVLSSVVYNNYFDDANYYCQNLETLNESLKQFELVYLTSKNVGSISIKGSMTDSTNKSTAGFQATSFYRDTLRIEDYNRYVDIINKSIEEIFRINREVNNDSIFLMKKDHCKSHHDSYNNLDNYQEVISKIFEMVYLNYNRYVQSIRDFLRLNRDNSSFLMKKDHCKSDSCYMLNWLIRGNLDNNQKVISKNFEMIYLNMLSLQDEIANVKRAISSSNNYDTLINWATVNQENSVNTGSAYLDKLTKNAQKDYKCSLTIPVCDKTARFFPILLIFHTLIVLVLAFVTQLLISDKSVTEPL